MKVTVAICTFNRAAYLPDAINSVLSETVDGVAVEVLVIDNASTDDTATLVKQLQEQAVNLRYVFESELGLSNARNTALNQACGDVTIFLDDDAIANPGFAASHAGCYADARVGAAGGPIEITWPQRRPKWMPSSCEPLYTKLELADDCARFPAGLAPFGANMSVRTSLANEIGQFNPALGRIGTSLNSAEEIDFFDRLRGLSEIAYASEARVRHRVLPDRVRVAWLLRRSFAGGRSDAVAKSMRGIQPSLVRDVVSVAANLGRAAVMRCGDDRGLPAVIGGASQAAMACGRLTAQVGAVRRAQRR